MHKRDANRAVIDRWIVRSGKPDDDIPLANQHQIGMMDVESKAFTDHEPYRSKWPLVHPGEDGFRVEHRFSLSQCDYSIPASRIRIA